MKFLSVPLAFSVILAWGSISRSDDVVETFLDQVAKESEREQAQSQENLGRYRAILAQDEKNLAKLEKEIAAKSPRKKPAPRKRPADDRSLTDEEVFRAWQKMQAPPNKAKVALDELIKKKTGLAEKVRATSRAIDLIEKRRTILVPTIDVFSPRIGSIGVVQGRISFSVAQIAADGSIHAIPERGDDTGNRVIIRGMASAGLADGSRFVPANIMRVSGTEAYTTVTGARATVFVLEPLAISKAQFEEETTKRMAEIKKAKEAKEKP